MESIKELKIKCQSHKTAKDFPLSKGYVFHRNISIYITKFLLVFFPKIKPNQITVLFFIISIGGAYLLLSSDFYGQLLGIILIYLGFLLDKVDGEIARYKNIFSLRGAYLDELYHFIIPSFLIFTFLYDVLWLDRLFTLLILAVIVLNILNRLNRKIYFIFFAKYRKELFSNKFYFNAKGNFLNKIFNSWLFKIFSLIERFDIVIFSILVAILLEGIWQIDIRIYYLYIYFAFSLLYFMRWTWLNYFGHLESKLRNFLDN